MITIDKLLVFLKENTHQYVQDVLRRFKQVEQCRKTNSDLFNGKVYKQLEKETGLGPLDLDKLVKYYDVLKQRDLLDRIIGVGDDVSHADEVVAGAFYCMNTFNFMYASQVDYTEEQLDNAIWDPTYELATGFRPQYEALI